MESKAAVSEVGCLRWLRNCTIELVSKQRHAGCGAMESHLMRSPSFRSRNDQAWSVAIRGVITGALCPRGGHTQLLGWSERLGGVEFQELRLDGEAEAAEERAT